jgi:hypothetical protein
MQECIRGQTERRIRTVAAKSDEFSQRHGLDRPAVSAGGFHSLHPAILRLYPEQTPLRSKASQANQIKPSKILLRTSREAVSGILRLKKRT